MKLTHLALVALLVSLSACGSNPSPPAVENVSLRHGSLPAGSTQTVDVLYRLKASGSGSDYQTEAFSSLVSLPPGASFVAGSSSIINQGPRVPDAQGSCPDGRSYLLFNFAPGEIQDSFNFEEFTAPIGFDVVLQLPAEKGIVTANASTSAPADPCMLIEGEESATFRVSAS